MRTFWKGRSRFTWYAAAAAVLALLLFAAARTAMGTGAWLTDEGDWQYLAGEYRVGTIDYTVSINDQTLMDQTTDKTSVNTYEMAVPLLAGVRMYDPTLTDADLRTREFNEGATLIRVRVVNRSDSMVDVRSAFTLMDQAAKASPIRVLPLSTDLDEDTAASLNYRKYVVDTLALTAPGSLTTEAEEQTALAALADAYSAYLTAHPQMELTVGLLPGAVVGVPQEGDTVFDSSTGKYYYYKDIFLIAWAEYDGGSYDSAAASAPVSPQARFHAVFTVGQLD